jgi:hypothetical protein
VGKVGKIYRKQRNQEEGETPKTNESPPPLQKHERDHEKLKDTLSDSGEDTKNREGGREDRLDVTKKLIVLTKI